MLSILITISFTYGYFLSINALDTNKNDVVFALSSEQNRRMKNIKNSFILADDIERDFMNKIPLYLFGLLY